MILLIDVGNCRVKWGTLREGRLGAVTGATHREAVLDDLWQDLWGALPPPGRVVVANVAGAELARSLSEWCRRKWDVEVEYAVAGAFGGRIRNGYTEPGRLGIDRWLAMMGAATLTNPPFCVVDGGTALTVDAVGQDGGHLGGWIVPGQVMMVSLLGSGTNAVQVERLAGETGGGFGRNTAAAVNSGALYAAAGLVRAAIDLLAQQGGDPVACVVTGGDAPVMLPLLPAGCVHSPELVLLGLAAWVREGEKGSSG